MFRRHLGKAMALGLAASLVGACGNGSSASPGTGGSAAGSAGTAGGAGAVGNAGAAGSAGAAGIAGGAGGATNDGGLDAPTGAGGAGIARTCDQEPTPLRSSGTVLELPFELAYEGRPFLYGEPNAIAGQSLIPTNVRFYVSQVGLLGPGGSAIPVDIVTASGAPQPYGVFLFNAESADAQTFRVLAPPGAYDGLTFALGLAPACNQGSTTGRVFPLSADSQMTWPIPFGYLFLRYEGVISGDADAGAALARSIHMGGDITDLERPAAIAVRLDGPLSIPSGSGSARKAVRVAMDQIFKGAASDVDLSDFPVASAGEEIRAGERLRRSGAGLPLFTFAP